MDIAQFNWVDYLILLVFLFSFISGASRGFVREVIGLITLIAAFLIASMYAEDLARFFTSSPSAKEAIGTLSSSIGVDTEKPLSYFALGCSFAIIFMLVSVVGSIIGYFFGSAANSIGFLNLGNRLMGGLFGLIKGFIINLVLIFLLQLTPVGSQPFWANSVLVHRFQPAVQWLASFISPTLNNISAVVNDTWHSLQNRSNSNGG